MQDIAAAVAAAAAAAAAVAVAAEGLEDFGTRTAPEAGSTDNVNMIIAHVLPVGCFDIGRLDYMNLAGVGCTVAAKVELDIDPAAAGLGDLPVRSVDMAGVEEPIDGYFVREVAESMVVAQRVAAATGAAEEGSRFGRSCWAEADSLEVLEEDKQRRAAGVEVGKEQEEEEERIGLEDTPGRLEVDAGRVRWEARRDSVGEAAARPAPGTDNLPGDSNLLVGSEPLLI